MSTQATSLSRLTALPAGMRSHAAEVSRLFKLLSHEVRLLVLCHLSADELSVGEINARVPLSQSALSQHLAALRAEGLVSTRRQGQSIFYRLADPKVARILTVLHDIYCRDTGNGS